MTKVKIRLNSKNQHALSILYTKFLGVANHISTDTETDVTEFQSVLENVPRIIAILAEYAAIVSTQFPTEKLPEVIAIELSSPATISKLTSLFSTPEETCNQILHLGNQVKIVEERLDASKAFFFDYQQFHRLPEVLHEICKAMNRVDILEDFFADVSHKSILDNFKLRH